MGLSLRCDVKALLQIQDGRPAECQVGVPPRAASPSPGGSTGHAPAQPGGGGAAGGMLTKAAGLSPRPAEGHAAPAGPEEVKSF